MTGILNGKKRKYNQLILNSLFFGNKTTQQIAEYIFQNDPQEKEDRKQILHIRSVIERPRGRLDELKTCGYIKRETNVWELTIKGLALTLTWLSTQDIEQSHFIKDFNDNIGTERNRDINMKTLTATLCNPDVMKVIVEDFFSEFLNNPTKFLLSLRETTKKLLRSGIDLDEIAFEDLGGLAGVDMGRLIEEKATGVRKKGRRKCQKCGKISSEKYNFCPYCGQPLN